MTDDRYAVNRNEGMDTLHRNAREECNLDDAEGRVGVELGRCFGVEEQTQAGEQAVDAAAAEGVGHGRL